MDNARRRQGCRLRGRRAHRGSARLLTPGAESPRSWIRRSGRKSAESAAAVSQAAAKASNPRHAAGGERAEQRRRASSGDEPRTKFSAPTRFAGRRVTFRRHNSVPGQNLIRDLWRPPAQRNKAGPASRILFAVTPTSRARQRVGRLRAFGRGPGRRASGGTLTDVRRERANASSRSPAS